jgi:hypothetical protein
MLERKPMRTHDAATQVFNKTVSPGINHAKEYEVHCNVVSGKKGFLPTINGLYPVVFKPNSYVRKGVEVIGKGRGTGREPVTYR